MKKILFSLLLFVVCGVCLFSVSYKTSALSPYFEVNVGNLEYGGSYNTISPYTYIYFDFSSYNDDSEVINVFNLKDYFDYNLDLGIKLEGNDTNTLGEQVLYFRYYTETEGIKEDIIIDGNDSKLPKNYLYLMVIPTYYSYVDYQTIYLYVIDYKLNNLISNNFYNNLYIYKKMTFNVYLYDGWQVSLAEQIYLIDRRTPTQVYAYGSYYNNNDWVLEQIKRNFSSGYLNNFLNNGYNLGMQSETFSPNWLFTMIDSIDSILSINLLPNITIGTLLLIPLCLGLISLILVFWRKD